MYMIAAEKAKRKLTVWKAKYESETLLKSISLNLHNKLETTYCYPMQKWGRDNATVLYPGFEALAIRVLCE